MKRSSAPTQRLFLALVPEGLDENQDLMVLLGKAKRTLADRDKVVKWVPKDNWHVTLVFLGNVSEDKSELAQQLLSSWQPQLSQALTIHVHGLGAFPTAEQARVLWLGVSAEQELLDMQSSLEQLYMGNDFALENSQAYRPHMTLARFRNPLNAQSLLQLGGRKSFGDYTIKEVVLFESVLQGHFPKYIPLTRKALIDLPNS